MIRITYQRALPWFLALLVVAIDRATKIAIQHSLTAYDTISLIPGLLRIVHTENPGAAFGLLAEGNPMLRAVVLVGISTLVLVFVGVALWNPSNEAQSTLQRTGLGLVLGGAFGNLYDRAVHQKVTDFIDVYHRAWEFPSFNAADSAITIGACLILLDLLLGQRKNSRIVATTL